MLRLSLSPLEERNRMWVTLSEKLIGKRDDSSPREVDKYWAFIFVCKWFQVRESEDICVYVLKLVQIS